MPKLKLLKIKYPAYFGFPRPFYNLEEVKQMIKIIENKEIILKNKIITTSFDVSEDINGQNYIPPDGAILPNQLK
jgi:hypothetical protein